MRLALEGAFEMAAPSDVVVSTAPLPPPLSRRVAMDVAVVVVVSLITGIVVWRYGQPVPRAATRTIRAAAPGG